MSSMRLEDQLKEMIVERLMLKTQPDVIGDGDNLMKQWGLQSHHIAEVVVGLEEVYDLDLEDVPFNDQTFSTIARIAELVRNKQNG